MKRVIAILAFLLCVVSMKAQYPSEWNKYTTDGYFHASESGQNSENLSESKFKNNLLDQARSNLAKQIQIKVEEVSQLNKDVVDGKTGIHYTSNRSYSTDVDMQLAEAKTYFDPSTENQYVIVYINKEEARNFYKNEIQMTLSNVQNTFDIADNYVKSGFKVKAKEELQKALPLLEGEEMGKSFFWLNIFGMPENQLNQYLEQVHQSEQTLKAKLAEMEHSTTYCVVCTADSFGKSYNKLQNEVKGELSATGCNFVEDPAAADYVIRINASAREYNKMNTAGGSAFFTYVDAAVAIDKNATGQRIFEDELSIKGSHTLSYEEAARDGYKRISKEISKMLKENIKL